MGINSTLQNPHINKAIKLRNLIILGRIKLLLHLNGAHCSGILLPLFFVKISIYEVLRTIKILYKSHLHCIGGGHYTTFRTFKNFIVPSAGIKRLKVSFIFFSLFLYTMSLTIKLS